MKRKLHTLDIELLNKLNIHCNVDDEEDDDDVMIDETQRFNFSSKPRVIESHKVSTDKKISLLNRRGRPSIDPSADRRWACGCGKIYLTYGALYSHTRIKHGGVQPPGSIRMRDINRKPRVRPVDSERYWSD